MRRPKFWFPRRRLKRRIRELTSLAKELAPEAEVIDVLIPGYEELDAWIDIVVPDDKEELISDALSQRREEIFTNEGYHIGLGITERSQYEAAQEKLHVTI